jgi:hypothetical protein
MSKPTYAQQAADLNLWREYVDPQRAVSDEDFHAMSLADREARIVETFGPEMVIPTVDDILTRTHFCGHCHEWGGYLSGGSTIVSRADLRSALLAAYDPTDPNWVAFVEIDKS